MKFMLIVVFLYPTHLEVAEFETALQCHEIREKVERQAVYAVCEPEGGFGSN